LPAIRKVAIYEPALSINGSTPLGWLKRYSPDAAGSFRKKLLRDEDKNGSGEYLTLRKLIPTLHYDGILLIEVSGTVERFRAMTPGVLLLGGSKSPAFQKASLDGLEKGLPVVKRVEFTGFGHAGTWNYDKRRTQADGRILLQKSYLRFLQHHDIPRRHVHGESLRKDPALARIAQPFSFRKSLYAEGLLIYWLVYSKLIIVGTGRVLSKLLHNY
jgi:hypothetical protein